MTDAAFALKPVRIMEAFLGRPFRAVMTVEVGGCNAFQPLLVAAASGLPVVDADAMGRRAYLEAQMQTFSIAGLQMVPHVVSDIRDNDVIIPTASGWHEMERLRRKVCTEYGSVATTCQAPRSGGRGEASRDPAQPVAGHHVGARDAPLRWTGRSPQT